MVVEICKGYDDIYDKIANKEDLFKFKKKVLLNYLEIKEEIPFSQYFKNQIIRFIKKDSLKKYLFLKKEEIYDFNLIKSIILNIQIAGQKKLENKINLDYINSDVIIDTNNNIDKSEIIETNNNLNKSEIINPNINLNKSEIINPNINLNKSGILNPNNNLNKSGTINPNNRINKSIIIKSINNKDMNIVKNKIKKKNDSTNTSSMSINMNVMREKLLKNQEDIDELISQKEYLLNLIVNENNESNDKRLKYFVDTNNLSGEKLEKSGIKYIFELLNCLSINQDFYFCYDVGVNVENLNNIFSKNELDKIPDIQIDFIISDLRIIDLINMLIYLYPNIIYLNNLKEKPCKKGMDLNQLNNLRTKYKKSHKRIDIFGEIGVNIFTEDEKITQQIKYNILCNNLKKLIEKKHTNDAEKIFEQLKMKKDNEKLILFLTNGEYSKIYNKNFKNEKIIRIQNENNINSLIIYLNNNHNSKENNVIENLIFNYGLNDGKNKFIKQLIDLKQKKIKQSIINDNFKDLCLKLNIIENKLRNIEKDYALFIKNQKEKLMINDLTSLFFQKESEINKYLNVKLEDLYQFELYENIKFDHEINIILLHPNDKNINTEVFMKLKNKKLKENSEINIYDFGYNCDISNFDSFEAHKKELTKKPNKKIYIIISYYSNLEDHFYAAILFKNLITNYLSYIFFITEEENKLTSKYFIDSHIKIYKYSEGIENVLKTDIENKFNEIKNNYKKFLINSIKYTRILDEYNKSYKYKLITTRYNNDKKEKIKFKDIINEHNQLLIEKISQDISFIISLSIENKDKIKILIEKDLKSIIEKNNVNIIELFLKNQTITKELSGIMINFIKNIEENDDNSIYKNLTEEEKTFKYSEEIISINGIHEIYKDDESEDEDENDENEENENIDNINNIIDNNNIDNNNIDNKGNNNNNIINNDDNQDNKDNNNIINNNIDNKGNNNYNNKDNIKNNFSNNKENNKSNIISDKKGDSLINEKEGENTFEIELITKEIEDKLKDAIILINLKFYYSLFYNTISKIFINDVLKRISENILKETK